MPRDTKPSKPDADSPTTDTKPYARSPNKNKKHQLFYGEKRTGAWTTQEDKLLFEMLYPKASGVNWEAVVQKVEGRDIKVSDGRVMTSQSGPVTILMRCEYRAARTGELTWFPIYTVGSLLSLPPHYRLVVIQKRLDDFFKPIAA